MNKILKKLICFSTIFCASTGCYDASRHYTWDTDPNNYEKDVEIVKANGFINMFDAYNYKVDGVSYSNSTYKWEAMRTAIKLLIEEDQLNLDLNKADYYVTDPKGEIPTGNGEEIVLFLQVCTRFDYKEVYKLYEKMETLDSESDEHDYSYAVFDSTIIITDSSTIVNALSDYKFL